MERKSGRRRTTATEMHSINGRGKLRLRKSCEFRANLENWKNWAQVVGGGGAVISVAEISITHGRRWQQSHKLQESWDDGDHRILGGGGTVWGDGCAMPPKDSPQVLLPGLICYKLPAGRAGFTENGGRFQERWKIRARGIS